jgi:NAD(P)H-hydrate epimerase
MLKSIFKKRSNWSRKGDFGKLLVIGGNKEYTGAPALSAMAALKTGVDIVSVAAPKRAADIIAGFSPDLITHTAEINQVKDLLAYSKQFDAVVIGPGLGRNPDSKKAAAEFIKKCSLPIVIDGDAIHAVADNKEAITK